MSLYLGALLIFALRIGDVSAATLRVIFLVNGRRLPATLFALAESSIWILAISRVFSHLDHWQNMVGYACGYAAGTLTGITLEQFIAFGQIVVRIYTRDTSPRLRDKLAAEGYGVTQFSGEGRTGTVQELMVVSARRRRNALVALVRATDAAAFVTVEATTHTYGGYMPQPVRDHNK